MNVLVVGYYNHYNLGDEQYKISIRYVLERIIPVIPQTVDFIDCDLLQNHDTTCYNIVLLGGGDVLNHYFLDKLNKKFSGELRRPKIIAFSVGIPYNSIFLEKENLKKLAILDTIYLRTKQDISLFSQYYDSNRLFYLPDTSCFLMDAVPIRHITPETTSTSQYKKIFHSIRLLSKTRKIVNINLCRHIYSRTEIYKPNYYNIVRELAAFIEKLIKRGFFIVFLPFNTKPIMPQNQNESISIDDCENDILIQQDVLKHITNKSNIINIDFTMSISEVLSLYQFFYISIPMRFHGCLFSIHAGIPLIPIYTTKKIKNILLDIDWKYSYVLDKNEKDLPTSFDSEKMMQIFTDFLKNYSQNKMILANICENFKNEYRAISNSICDELYTDLPEDTSTNTIPTNTIEQSNKTGSTSETITSKQVDDTNLQLFNPDPVDIIPDSIPNIENLVENISQKLADFARENGYNDFRAITDPSLQQIAVCIVSYYITKQIDSNYNHGMLQKMFTLDYNYKKEWAWVIQHYNQSDSIMAASPNIDAPISTISSSNIGTGIFDIEYINQDDRSGAHRSGWKYVYDNIRHLHSSTAPIKLDLYVDRTFHWKLGIYKYIGIVPYTTPWIGFIHHTFDTEFSDYNNNVLFECPEFLESLRTCRGLIVLSYYLKEQIEQKFLTIPSPHPPVYVLRHPTIMENIPMFDITAFLNNPDKKLVNIGGWLRNIFAFYRLQLSAEPYKFDVEKMTTDIYTIAQQQIPTNCKCAYTCRWERTIRYLKSICCKPQKNSILRPQILTDKIRKVALKGKYMDNYFPKTDEIQQIKQVLANIENNSSYQQSKYCSHGSSIIQNNWMKHMIDYIESLHNEMHIISTMDNTDYDDLLTKNLVFINLVDGSAINTIIECIVRNTPIIVNRHPAIMEVLGDDYPLYYTDISKVDGLLQDTLKIRDAHFYMKNRLDKSWYNIDTFVQGLVNILSHNNEIQI